MALIEFLKTTQQIVVKQRREAIELVGIEKKNAYDIAAPDGTVHGLVRERGKGFFALVLRQILRHWRSFNLVIEDNFKQPFLHVKHPFRIYFQRLEISDPLGQQIGYMEKKFSIFSRKFVIHAANSSSEITMTAGFFKIWTFPFEKNGQQVATVEKKWGGAMREIFLDTDNFLIQFEGPNLSLEERQLIFAAAIFIDLTYFEENQGFSLWS